MVRAFHELIILLALGFFLYCMHAIASPASCDRSPSLDQQYTDTIRDTELIAAKVGFSISETKSSEEADRYISCYQSSQGKKFDNLYQSKIKGWIKKAATSFGIDEILLKCLFFRESGGWVGETSSAPAYGITQTKKDSIESVNQLFVKYDKEKVTELLDEKKEDLKTRMTVTLPKMHEKKATRQIAQEEESIRVLKVQITNLEFRIRVAEQWKNYWAGIGQPSPKNVSIDDVVSVDKTGVKADRAIETSIAVGAAWLNRVMIDFKDKKKPKALTADFDRAVMIAGAYNTGSGKMAHTCPLEQGKLSQCLAKFPSDSEPVRHMKSIENCMKRGNNNPPDGTGKRNCTASHWPNLPLIGLIGFIMTTPTFAGDKVVDFKPLNHWARQKQKTLTDSCEKQTLTEYLKAYNSIEAELREKTRKFTEETWKQVALSLSRSDEPFTDLITQLYGHTLPDVFPWAEAFRNCGLHLKDLNEALEKKLAPSQPKTQTPQASKTLSQSTIEWRLNDSFTLWKACLGASDFKTGAPKFTQPFFNCYDRFVH